MKKPVFKLCSAMAILFLMTSISFAHCIWSESPAKVELNQEFTVKAFYADPDDPVEERDKTNMSLYLFTPGGEVQALELNEKSTFYQTSAMLTETGQHLFVLERDPSRYRLQEIRDFGKSVTWAGEQGGIVHDPVGLALEIVPVKTVELENGQLELTLQVLYEGNPVTEGDIEVFKSLTPVDPVYDEIDEIELESDGSITLSIDPAYRYVLETDHYVPARDVAGTGFAITEVRFRSTLYIANQ